MELTTSARRHILYSRQSVKQDNMLLSVIWQQCAYLIITANLTNSLYFCLILIPNHLFSYSLWRCRRTFSQHSLSYRKFTLQSLTLSELSFSQIVYSLNFPHGVLSLNYKVGTWRKYFRPAETQSKVFNNVVQDWWLGYRNKDLCWNDSRLAGHVMKAGSCESNNCEYFLAGLCT